MKKFDHIERPQNEKLWITPSVKTLVVLQAKKAKAIALREFINILTYRPE